MTERILCYIYTNICMCVVYLCTVYYTLLYILYMEYTGTHGKWFNKLWRNIVFVKSYAIALLLYEWVEIGAPYVVCILLLFFFCYTEKYVFMCLFMRRINIIITYSIIIQQHNVVSLSHSLSLAQCLLYS